MTLYVRTDKKNKILEVLTLQEVKQRHAKTASITGAPETIEIETEESAAERKRIEKKNEKDREDHPPEEFEEPFIPKPLPAQEFYTYVRATDEPPVQDNRVIERGEVKFVDGAFRVTYTSRALTIEEQQTKRDAKAKQDKLEKLQRLQNPHLAADTILLVHQLAIAAKLDIPQSIAKFMEEYE